MPWVYSLLSRKVHGFTIEHKAPMSKMNSLPLYEDCFGYNFYKKSKAIARTHEEYICAMRTELYSVDKRILGGAVTSYASLKDLAKEQIKNGRFSVIADSAHFENLFVFKNSNRLYVFLSGARPLSQGPPIFKRWSWFKHMNGSVLSISDPMFYEYPKCSLGWYYGTPEINWLETTALLALKVAEGCGIKPEDIVFYGSSGGGWAACWCASYIPGSLAIAINPQIFLDRYNYAETFSKITGNSLKNDALNRNNLYERMKVSSSKFMIIQNISDHDGLDDHISPLMKIYDIDGEYGINARENLLVWLYMAKGGHTTQETLFILPHILNLAEDFSKDNFSLPKEKILFYQNITEIWHAYYNILRELQHLQKS